MVAAHAGGPLPVVNLSAAVPAVSLAGQSQFLVDPAGTLGVDALRMVMYVFPAGGGKPEKKEIPAEHKSRGMFGGFGCH